MELRDGEIWYEERNRPPAIFSNKWGDFHLLFAPLQPSPTLPSRLLNALDEGDVLLVTRLTAWPAVRESSPRHLNIELDPDFILDAHCTARNLDGLDAESRLFEA